MLLTCAAIDAFQGHKTEHLLFEGSYLNRINFMVEKEFALLNARVFGLFHCRSFHRGGFAFASIDFSSPGLPPCLSSVCGILLDLTPHQ